MIVSKKTLNCLKLMKETGCKLVPRMGVRRGAKDYVCDSRFVGRMGSRQKDRMLEAGVLKWRGDNMCLLLVEKGYERLLEKLAKRRKLRNSDDPHRPVPKGVQ